MKSLFAAAAGSAALFAASQALATITVISTAPFPQNPPENVLLNANASGTTIFGTTNQTGTGVTFSSLESLNATSNGQASITALDSSLNTLNIALSNPALGFSAFEFNLTSNVTGPLTLTFTDQFGHTQTGTTSFTVSQNGSNFFDAVASNGELITKVSVSGANLSNVGQVRLGGVINLSSVTGASIPEPASWALMIFGIGGAGGALRLRRRHRHA